MATTEERMKVLQMLEEGTITAEEATQLLKALHADKPPQPSEGRQLLIHVTDLRTGKGKVNIRVPLGLVTAGMRVAERYASDVQGFDAELLQRMIESGADGKLMEVTDEEQNQRVEIYLEQGQPRQPGG